MPLPKEGKDKLRWKAHQDKEREKVRQRFVQNGWRCEGCNQRLYQAPEVHHCFSRTFILGEPWASSAELCAALCHNNQLTDKVGCHERVTNHVDPKLEYRLRETAARRFYAAHKTRYPSSLNPDGAVRRLVKKLEREAA